MKIKHLVIAVAITLFGTITYAQKVNKGKNQESGGQKLTEQMKTDLQLNDQQTQKVAAINNMHSQKIKEIKAKNLDQAQQKEQIEKVRQVHLASLQEVLTPAQFEKYSQMRNEAKATNGNGKNKAAQNQKNNKNGKSLTDAEKADKILAKMTESLALNDKQISKLKPIISKHIENMSGLKNGELEADAKKQAVKEEKEAFDAQLKTVLTEEQFKTLLAEREEHKQKQAEKKKQQGKNK